MSFINNLLATWGNAAQLFDGIKLNVSNGSNGAPVYLTGSKFLRLQSNGTDMFSVDPLGNIYTAAGILNTPVSVTGAQAVSTAWDGQKIALSNGFYTLTFSTPSTYSTNFSVMLFNIDSAAAKYITLTGVGSFRLWPGQYIIVYRNGATWNYTPLGRWAIPFNGYTLYLATTGSDANDGLSASRPFLTLNGARDAIMKEMDLDFNNLTVQMADGTYSSSGLHWPGPTVGQQNDANVLFKGNIGSPSNVIIDPTDGSEAVAVFNGGWVQLQALRVQCTTTSAAALKAKSNGKIENVGSLVFGTVNNPGASHMFTQQGGHIIHSGNYSIAGGAGDHILNQDTGGLVLGKSITVSFLADAAFVVFAQSVNVSMIDYSGATFTLNGHTITGKRYQADALSLINTNGGGANFFPGDAGGSTSAGGQYI